MVVDRARREEVRRSTRIRPARVTCDTNASHCHGYYFIHSRVEKDKPIVIHID